MLFNAMVVGWWNAGGGGGYLQTLKSVEVINEGL